MTKRTRKGNKNQTKPFFNEKSVVLAHRGDSHHFPENTLPAFEAAAGMNVDVIETDVHITADGEVVVWHDETLERMSGMQGAIPSLNLNEVRKADAGYLFSPDGGKSFPFRGQGVEVVRLEDILKALPAMRFNVDLKDKSSLLVEKYADILKRTGAVDRVCTASFHTVNLKQFRRLLPEGATSFTKGEVIRAVLLSKVGLLRLQRRFKGDVFQGPAREGKLNVATRGLIRNLQRRGIQIHLWTINEADEMNRLLDLGVDGIFTDNPGVLMRVLEERKASN